MFRKNNGSGLSTKTILLFKSRISAVTYFEGCQNVESFVGTELPQSLKNIKKVITS